MSKKKHKYGATYRTVMRLVDGLEGDYYRIYMDRFYTSPQLLADLKELKIAACGTIMANRLFLSQENISMIQNLISKEMKYFRSPSSLTLCCWKDNKTVLILSNFHNPEEIEKERRKRKSDRKDDETEENNHLETVSMPKVVDDYNLYMRGVDKFGQLSTYYPPEIRTHRWYIKVFLHLLEIVIINSYTLYKSTFEKEKKKSIDPS